MTSWHLHPPLEKKSTQLLAPKAPHPQNGPASVPVCQSSFISHTSWMPRDRFSNIIITTFIRLCMGMRTTTVVQASLAASGPPHIFPSLLLSLSPPNWPRPTFISLPFRIRHERKKKNMNFFCQTVLEVKRTWIEQVKQIFLKNNTEQKKRQEHFPLLTPAVQAATHGSEEKHGLAPLRLNRFSQIFFSTDDSFFFPFFWFSSSFEFRRWFRSCPSLLAPSPAQFRRKRKRRGLDTGPKVFLFSDQSSLLINTRRGRRRGGGQLF